MAKRTKKKATGQSPYKKYGKTEYKYAFKNCNHNNSEAQSTPLWKGRICTSCKIIVAGPF